MGRGGRSSLGSGRRVGHSSARDTERHRRRHRERSEPRTVHDLVAKKKIECVAGTNTPCRERCGRLWQYTTGPAGEFQTGRALSVQTEGVGDAHISSYPRIRRIVERRPRLRDRAAIRSSTPGRGKASDCTSAQARPHSHTSNHSYHKDETTAGRSSEDSVHTKAAGRPTFNVALPDANVRVAWRESTVGHVVSQTPPSLWKRQQRAKSIASDSTAQGDTFDTGTISTAPFRQDHDTMFKQAEGLQRGRKGAKRSPTQYLSVGAPTVALALPSTTRAIVKH